jgi:hypothetical protein
LGGAKRDEVKSSTMLCAALVDVVEKKIKM